METEDWAELLLGMSWAGLVRKAIERMNYEKGFQIRIDIGNRTGNRIGKIPWNTVHHRRSKPGFRS